MNAQQRGFDEHFHLSQRALTDRTHVTDSATPDQTLPGPRPPRGTSARTADGATSAPAGPSVVLSTEQLVTATDWVESGAVRLRRRIVTEIRTIEVELRREELVIEARNLTPGARGGESYRGSALDGPTTAGVDPSRPPVVVVLREEVPDVAVRARAYQRVTARVELVEEAIAWHDILRREQATLETPAP